MKEKSVNNTEEIAIENTNESETITADSEQSESTSEKTEVEVLKEDLQKEREKYIRLFAEFDNFKKRTSKERIELYKTANQEVMSALLPVLDDFQRAMVEIEKSGSSDETKGVELIFQKLEDILSGLGLDKIEVNPGDEFNTDWHEAITRIPAPSDELKGKIVDTVETGYTLKDKVLRYSKVVVGE